MTDTSRQELRLLRNITVAYGKGRTLSMRMICIDALQRVAPG